MEKNLISVIIPVWRPDLSNLTACINSVINQTYTNIEIILVYKKSAEFDNKFYSLMKNFNDSRLEIIEHNDKGVASALNAGIKKSHGEFIARIDADDFCENNRFERQIQFKKTHDYDIVGTWAHYITNEGRRIRDLEFPIKHEEIRKKMMLYDPILHPTVLMDKSVLEEIGFYDASLVHAEDYELWFRAILHGYRFGNVPEPLVNIRNNPESASRGSEWKKHRDYVIKIRRLGLTKYGFSKPLDVFYYFIGNIFYFIPPKLSVYFRKIKQS